MLMATDSQAEYGLSYDIIKGEIPVSGVFDLEPLSCFRLQSKPLLSQESILQQRPCLHIPRAALLLFVSLGRRGARSFSGNRNTIWQRGRHQFTAIEGLAEADSPLCQPVIDFMARCDSS